MAKPVTLDGHSLTIDDVVAVARRATATTSSMVREWPSSVTGFAMGTQTKAPEWLVATPAPESTRTAYFEPETTVPVAIEVDCPARICSSGLPGSVWKLQSKIT